MIPLLFLAFMVGILFLAWYLRATQPRFYSRAEYWVYTDQDRLPPQEEIMTRIIGRNPYVRPRFEPIGPTDGLFMSDVRLAIALVRKEKNPHLFDPTDLVSAEFSDQDLNTAMVEAKTLVRLSYISEQPLRDRRHLQFLAHAADAYASLTGSKLILDPIAGIPRFKPQMENWLSQELDLTTPEKHVLWEPTTSEQTTKWLSKGFVKLGYPEIETYDVSTDQAMLTQELLESLTKAHWNGPLTPDENFEVEVYGDRFVFLLEKTKSPKVLSLRILRIQKK